MLLITLIILFYGYLFFEYKNIMKKKYYFYVISVLCIIINIIVANKFLIYISSIIILYTCYCNFSDNNNKFCNIISKNSFGMYLFHSPLVYITYTYLNNCKPIIVMLVNFIIGGIVSFLITEIIRKTFFSFFIGEYKKKNYIKS